MQENNSIYHLFLICFLLFFTKKIDAQNLFFQHYTTDDGLPHNVIHVLKQDKQGFLWIGTEDGLSRFDGFQFYNFIQQKEAAQSKVIAIQEAENTTVWVKYESGKFRGFEHGVFSEKTIKVAEINTLFKQNLSNKEVVISPTQRFKIDKESIFFMDAKTNEINDLSEELNLQSAPTFLLKDAENNVWLATDGGGLYCIYDAPFTNYSIENGLKNTFVHDISENKKGEILAGTKNGLYKLSNKKWQEERLNLHLEYDKIEVWQFRQTSDKKIIFSSDLGIIRYDDEPKLCIPDRNTSKVFILDSYNRVNLFYRNFFYIYPNCDSEPIRWPITDDAIKAGYCLFEDTDENLWMGTNEGAIRFKRGLSERFTVKNGLPNNRINDIKQDSSGSIWFATERGLSKLNANGKFTNFTQEDGLLSNTCRKIGIDSRGGIWVASPQGLHYFDEKNIIPYNARTGLVSNDINSLFVDSQKRLWIGTSQGISMLDITNLPQQVQPPKMILESIELNDKIVSTSVLQSLSFDNRLRFHFTAIAFIDAQKVQFQYRISEKDVWQTTSSRSILLTNLREGDYNLQIRAKKINSDWSKSIEIPFQIHPPWWRTIWAILAYFVVFVLLIIGLLQYIRSREKRKTKFNKQLAELELSALQAQMNPHFIFNSLNAIQNFVLKNDALIANEYLSKFAQLMRLILESSKSRYITIADEIKLLKLYVDLEHLCYPDKFDFQFDIANDLDEEDFEIPTMIIQPYIENAINHGLNQKATKGILIIEMKQINHQIIVHIKDDGIGRKKAQLNRQKPYQSHGMSMTNDRLKVLNYIENSDIMVEVGDLFLNENDTGTLVKIWFPIEN